MENLSTNDRKTLKVSKRVFEIICRMDYAEGIGELPKGSLEYFLMYAYDLQKNENYKIEIKGKD